LPSAAIGRGSRAPRPEGASAFQIPGQGQPGGHRPLPSPACSGFTWRGCPRPCSNCARLRSPTRRPP